ncbi:permease [Mobiluncus porci]|uniref:Permease n=1 Tax=Mobiluncus porci TaxID=2652278 RepID=A0A7K0K576_9ACTO|nr:permease [Mobiluncus porci]MST50230.1 permease [Mobiluncus porci]
MSLTPPKLRSTLRPLHPETRGGAVTWLTVAALIWAGLYWLNENLWNWIFAGLGLDTSEHIPGAVHFFFYDSAKVLLLLVGMIFVIGLFRTALNAERVRDYLLGKPLALALVLAAALGAVTPFCSCSSIPLFIGFVAAGVPLGVTLTFLLASPLVNEVAVVMLAQSFGWQVTLAYVASGLLMAILLGALFTRLQLENQVKDFVRNTPVAKLQAEGGTITLARRIDAAQGETREIVGRVWKWVLVGVGIGALIHGWVPADWLAAHAGRDNPLAVVLVTALGVPLYSNAAGVIPIAEALWAKGMATGTVLAFMMGTVALSFPEFILLKQVLKPKLLAIFFGSAAVSIMLLGFLFNLIFP